MLFGSFKFCWFSATCSIDDWEKSTDSESIMMSVSVSAPDSIRFCLDHSQLTQSANGGAEIWSQALLWS